MGGTTSAAAGNDIYFAEQGNMQLGNFFTDGNSTIALQSTGSIRFNGTIHGDKLRVNNLGGDVSLDLDVNNLSGR